MNLSGTSVTVCLVLLLIQLLAALPWLLLVFRSPGDRGLSWSRRDPLFWAHVRSFLTTAGVPVLGFLLFALVGLFFVEGGYLENAGLGYTALLQFQLTIDLFILLFAVLLRVWPKGGAVAQAAFRAGVRQPL